MKKTLLAFLLATAVSGAMAQQTGSNNIQVKPTDPVVVVNGKTVLTVNQFQANVARLTQSGVPVSNAENTVLNEAVASELVVDRAYKDGLEKQADVKASIEEAQAAVAKNILVEAAQRQFAQKNPVSDSELKSEYDRQVAALKGIKEYRIQNIVLKDDAAAKKLISDLKRKRTTFDKAAKTSLDTATADRGGLIDWTPGTDFVPEILKAVEKAKKGEIIANPIKTSFGYHVVRVDNVRPIQIAKFEDTKESLRVQLLQAKWLAYLESLRKDQDVKFPVHEELEKARTQ